MVSLGDKIPPKFFIMKFFKKIDFFIGLIWVVSLFIIIRYDHEFYNQRIEIFEKIPLLLLLFLTILIIPVFEEFMFRYGVLETSISNRKLLVSFIYFSIPIFYGKYYTLFFSFFIFLLLFSKYAVEKKQFYIIIVSSIFFSFLHLESFNNTFLPIEIIYYSILGYFLAKLAVSYGLRYSILGHIAYNFLFSIPAFILLYNSIVENPIYVRKQNFKVNIDNISADFQIGTTSFYSQDSIDVVNSSMKEVVSNLINCENCVVVKENNDVGVKYNVNASVLGDDNININELLLHEIIQNKLVDIDSVVIKNKVHYVCNSSKYCKKEATLEEIISFLGSAKKPITSLSQLSEVVRLDFSKTLISRNDNQVVLIDRAEFRSFEELRNYLKEEYCVIIEETDEDYLEYTIK